MIFATNPKTRILYCLLILLAVLAASCAQEKLPQFSIVTGGMEGKYEDVGNRLARIVNANQAINGFGLKDELSSGSVSNINALAAGEAQFGIAQADHQHQAVRGLGEWSDKGPQAELRAVFSMYPESVTLVAGGDTGINSVNDLVGKVVDIGTPGSGTRQNAIEVLTAAGIDWQNDIEARGEGLDERLARYMNGELDAFFYTAGHPNKDIKFATFSVRRARLIPLEKIDGLIAENPYFSRTRIPVDTYPRAFNNVDIETVGVNATLLTTASVPEDVVYTLTRAVFEYLDTLSGYDTDFSSLLNDRFLEGLTAPIHPGALRFYQEKGLQIPQD